MLLTSSRKDAAYDAAIQAVDNATDALRAFAASLTTDDTPDNPKAVPGTSPAR